MLLVFLGWVLNSCSTIYFILCYDFILQAVFSKCYGGTAQKCSKQINKEENTNRIQKLKQRRDLNKGSVDNSIIVSRANTQTVPMINQNSALNLLLNVMDSNLKVRQFLSTQTVLPSTLTCDPCV